MKHEEKNECEHNKLLTELPLNAGDTKKGRTFKWKEEMKEKRKGGATYNMKKLNNNLFHYKNKMTEQKWIECAQF